MKASCELDVLVDIHVMGHTPDEVCDGEPKHGGDDAGTWYCTKCAAYGNWGGDEWENHKRVPPNYSHSISAAWRVVECMQQNGWHFTLYGPHGFSRDYDCNDWECGWQAVFAKPKAERGNIDYVISADIATWTEETGETAPEALCLAALKAVGVEVTDA